MELSLPKERKWKSKNGWEAAVGRHSIRFCSLTGKKLGNRKLATGSVLMCL